MSGELAGEWMLSLEAGAILPVGGLDDVGDEIGEDDALDVLPSAGDAEWLVEDFVGAGLWTDGACDAGVVDDFGDFTGAWDRCEPETGDGAFPGAWAVGDELSGACNASDGDFPGALTVEGVRKIERHNWRRKTFYYPYRDIIRILFGERQAKPQYTQPTRPFLMEGLNLKSWKKFV